MPLRQPQPPEAVRRALQADVADYMESKDPMAKTLAQAPMALRVFTLRLDKIGESFKESPQPAGWRFMALAASGSPIAGEVAVLGDGLPRMVSLSRDEVITEMVMGARNIQMLPQVQARDYELRLLRIPGVRTEVFWLKPLVGEDHLIIPALTQSKRLLKKDPLPIAEFLSVLQDLASEFTGKSNAPPAEPPAANP